MAERRRVLIEHKDGRRYAVTPQAYEAQYREQGFKVERYEDGSPYVAPKADKPKTETKKDSE